MSIMISMLIVGISSKKTSSMYCHVACTVSSSVTTTWTMFELTTYTNKIIRMYLMLSWLTPIKGIDFTLDVLSYSITICGLYFNDQKNNVTKMGVVAMLNQWPTKLMRKPSFQCASMYYTINMFLGIHMIVIQSCNIHIYWSS